MTRPVGEINEDLWLFRQPGSTALVVHFKTIGQMSSNAKVFFINNDEVKSLNAASTRYIEDVAISPQGSLYLATLDNNAILVEAFTNEQIAGPPLAFGSLPDIAMNSPSGRSLAVVYNENIATGNGGLPLAAYANYANTFGGYTELFRGLNYGNLPDQLLNDTPDLSNGGRPIAVSLGTEMHVLVSGTDGGDTRHLRFDVQNGVALERPLAAPNTGVLSVAANADDNALRLVAYETTPNLHLLIGEVSPDNFEFDQLTPSEPIRSLGDIPIDRSENIWADDMFLFFGTYQNKNDTLGYAIWDLEARDRGRSPLTIREAELPGGDTRTILAVDVAQKDNYFGAAGGSLLVAWLERRSSGPLTEDRLYVDELACVPNIP
jgi:hypothetical protein